VSEQPVAVGGARSVQERLAGCPQPRDGGPQLVRGVREEPPAAGLLGARGVERCLLGVEHLVERRRQPAELPVRFDAVAHPGAGAAPGDRARRGDDLVEGTQQAGRREGHDEARGAQGEQGPTDPDQQDPPLGGLGASPPDQHRDPTAVGQHQLRGGVRRRREDALGRRDERPAVGGHEPRRHAPGRELVAQRRIGPPVLEPLDQRDARVHGAGHLAVELLADAHRQQQVDDDGDHDHDAQREQHDATPQRPAPGHVRRT
jgi:hypothetical protein